MINMKTSVLLFIIMYIYILATCTIYKQEKATVTYWNPKYISKATFFTMRSKRRDHYRTNVTVVITQTWSNNVTLKISYQSPVSAIDFNFVSKLCDVFTYAWHKKFLRKFSSISWSCPIVPATYEFTNVDLDQSVVPLPMPTGKNILKLLFYMTSTQERLLEGNVIIVVE